MPSLNHEAYQAITVSSKLPSQSETEIETAWNAACLQSRRTSPTKSRGAQGHSIECSRALCLEAYEGTQFAIYAVPARRGSGH